MRGKVATFAVTWFAMFVVQFAPPSALAAEVISTPCGGVDDVTKISWAVIPSFGGAVYVEIARNGRLRDNRGFRYRYDRYGVAPDYATTSVSDVLFARAASLVLDAQILTRMPLQPPANVIGLDGTNTFVSVQLCGKIVQVESHNTVDPGVNALEAALDSLVVGLTWDSRSITRPPSLPPVFRYPN